MFYAVGEPEVTVKSTAWANTEASEWAAIKNKNCITHLYRSEFDEQGQVTKMEALDLSQPQFQEFSEESLKVWKFAPGKAGQAFVDFVYSKDGNTRILLLTQDHAKAVAGKRAAQRVASPTKVKKVELVKQAAPEYPRGALLRGKIGMVTAQFDVNAAGVPENIRVIRAMPDNEFVRETRSTLGRWRYKTLAEQPDAIRSDIEVTIYYNIEDSLGYDCDLNY